MKELHSKTPKELGISDGEYIALAESLLISREFVNTLREGPLYYYHEMRVAYLEQYFGLNGELTSSIESD